MSRGLWADADEANAASLQQITKEKGDMTTNYQKKWSDMTEAEQKAEIEERRAAKQAKKAEGKDDDKKPAQQQTHQSSKGAGTQYVSCVHEGYKVAFTMFNETIKVAGAKGPSMREAPEDTKLIIDCAQQVKLNTIPWVKSTTSDHPSLKSLQITPPEPPPILQLDWPDRGEPRCDIEWWTDLLNVIKSDFSGGRIIIACMGSHGRTGTAMAALVLALAPKMSVEDAIKFIRKTHCYKAVESWTQVNYLREFRPNEDSHWLNTEAASDKPYHSGQTGWSGAGWSGGAH